MRQDRSRRPFSRGILAEDVVIDEIDLDNVYLGLEFKNAKSTDSNWTTIMSHLQTTAAPKAAGPEEKERTVLIHKLVLSNINTDLIFKEDSGKVKRLPTIDRIELTEISSQGGFPMDQLMNSVLGQMLKQVFIKQNMQNMLMDFLQNPPSQVEKYLQPFKRFIPMHDQSQESDLRSA